MSEIFLRCVCNRRIRLRIESAGKTGTCACGATITVPEADVFAQRSGQEVTLAELTDDAPATSPTTDLWRKGARVEGKYDVNEHLGQGTFGSVWRVRHLEWKMNLAVKEFLASGGNADSRKKTFERECQAWIDLGLHPNVVTAWYVRRIQDKPYLFLEYCEGGSLADRIDQGRTRDPGIALDIGIQLCRGLAHCHTKGIVHRDFKPLNVLMTGSGLVKLTDFGTVKFTAAEAGEGAEPNALDDLRKTIGGRLQGTPPYMPPEQWLTDHPVDFRADLYALGVTLFEMLTGEWPIRSTERNLPGWVRAHQEQEPPSLRATLPEAPESLDRLLRQLLAKRPEQRPGSALEVASALRAIYQEWANREYDRAEPSEAELLADALNNRGVSLMDLDQTEKAEQTWQEALKADPHHLEATYNLGLTRWRSAKETDADLLRDLREIQASRRDDPLCRLLLAQVHLERDDCESVERELEPLAKAKDKEAVALVARARARQPNSTRRLPFEGEALQWVSVFHLTADGWLFAALKEKIQLWDNDNRKCLQRYEGHTKAVTSIDVVAGGRYLLSSSEDKTLRVFEIATGRCLRTLTGHKSGVTSGCLLDGGRIAVSGSREDGGRVWDLSSGRCTRQLAGNGHEAYAVCAIGRGRHVLGGGLKGTLAIWDVDSRECLRQWKGHENVVEQVRVMRDGKRAVSAGQDHLIRVWDLQSGTCLQTLSGHTNWVRSMAFDPAGGLVVSGGSDGSFRIWDLERGRCWRTEQGRHIDTVALSEDGRQIYCGGSLKDPERWVIEPNGRAVAPLALCRAVTSEAAAAAGQAYRRALERAREALANGDVTAAVRSAREARAQPGCARKPKIMEVWHALHARLPRGALRDGWMAATLMADREEVSALCLCPGERHVLTAGPGNSMSLLDLPSGRLVRTFEGHSYRIGAMAVRADGKVALTGSRDKTLRLWDVTDGRCLRVIQSGEGIDAVALSPDGRVAFSANRAWSKPGQLKCWDVETGRCLRDLEVPLHRVSSIAFRPDGLLAVFGEKGEKHDQGEVRLRDVATGRSIRTFPDLPPCGVDRVLCTADGRQIVATQLLAIRRWDATTGNIFPSSKYTDTGSGANVACLAADGRTLAKAHAYSRTVSLWDLHTNQRIRDFEGHGDHVTAIALAGDARFAVSGSRDGSVRLWMLDWELEEREPADWDEAARPFLQMFLSAHTPYAAELPRDRMPTDDEITLALTRRGKPTWMEVDFQELLRTLGSAGLGWLRPEGVRRELQKMADEIRP